ncbi:hypothetical protein ACA910_001201 [Epithemia clementina (nom. ined.)]
MSHSSSAACNNNNDIDSLFDILWQDYVNLNPNVETIHNYFLRSKENETTSTATTTTTRRRVVNDHIALRTFNLPGLGMDRLARDFVQLGYQPKGEYYFAEKKLKARHYEGPTTVVQTQDGESSSSSWPPPRVFISELLVDELPLWVQDVIRECTAGVAELYANKDQPLLCVAGRPWPAKYETYQALYEQSEYAAWVYAFGFRPNHFTVSINALQQQQQQQQQQPQESSSSTNRHNHYESLQAVNAMLKAKGVVLNQAGGEIKGSPSVLLEQSSTMAEMVPVEFEDGTYSIPACYYEFALRYPLPNTSTNNGDQVVLFQGFVEGSADKIFESTHQS